MGITSQFKLGYKTAQGIRKQNRRGKEEESVL